ncbi:MAG: DUF1080 domain-containing protein [Planctomycetes bacterium]|nr:DUF1080 domain-containing protein [Planctomycetota bacterium]
MSNIQAAAVLFCSACTMTAFGAEPIPALVVTGFNNHNWKYTSRFHADTLAATGKFTVDITDTPETTLADAKAIAKYRIFILDFNDFGKPHRLGAAAEEAFVKAISDGAGVVAVHSANNAFDGWKQYEQMLGLMWREGTGHGQFHAFDIQWVDAKHPIVSGLPVWTGHNDELYHKLVNTQKSEFHLLAQAMSSKEKGGTGNNEPMAFTLEFGKGRIFATPLGHVWEGKPDGKGTWSSCDSQKASISDPQFKILLCRAAEWAATGAVTLPTAWADLRAHNTLSAADAAAGWTLLFDGKTTSAWRGYKQDKFPDKGWIIKDDALFHTAQGGGGDLCSIDEYSDFEFECEWRVGVGGNSGVMYRCTEDHNFPWETGPEMQILDDGVHADGKKPKTRAGTLYDIIACNADVSRPAGEWNKARAVVKGTHIQHYLNGFKVVDVDTASDEYKAALAASKWPGMPDFNTRKQGHICLQDHGDEVAFRNIRVRKLN